MRCLLFIRVYSERVGEPMRSAMCALCATARLPRSCPLVDRHSFDSNAFLCARLSQSTLSSRLPNRACLALHSCRLLLWNSAPRIVIGRCSARARFCLVCGVCPLISMKCFWTRPAYSSAFACIASLMICRVVGSIGTPAQCGLDLCHGFPLSSRLEGCCAQQKKMRVIAL